MHPSCAEFLKRLTGRLRPILLVDYDGTLAPFTPDRSHAVPYPEAAAALARIAERTSTRLVFVSGRSAKEVADFLRPFGLEPEIWGVHGSERLHPGQEPQAAPLSPKGQAILEQAWEMLRSESIEEHLEKKTRSIAVHWRGLDPAHRDELYLAARRVFDLLSGEDARLMEFDGGFELVIGGQNKGDAVRAILRETADPAAVAYLGDDVTDEDAFRELDDQGLSVLVRREYRPTAATAWLRPPEELTEFLNAWETACRRAA